ncbi:hypothetical protein MBLNU457_6677t2 [Dothideomycetes sp. NU457]
MAPIRRITMFKVPNPDDIQPLLDKYSTMQKDAVKDGKPYIIQCSATKAIEDPRSQGYNLIAMTVFSSLDDMKYYDEEDQAHAALKEVGKGKVDPPPIVIYSEAASA